MQVQALPLPLLLADMDDGIDLRQPDLREHPQTFATYGVSEPAIPALVAKRDLNAVKCRISAVRTQVDLLENIVLAGSDKDVDRAMDWVDLAMEDLRLYLLQTP